MISQENIDKFNSIIAYYKLDTARILDVGRAICTSDILYGTNDKKLSIKRLANSGVDIFRPLYQGSAEPLPDVQVMRVICDTLYYNLLFKGRGVGKVGIHITSEASDSIGKGIGNKQYIPVANGYSDMEECQKVLDLMYEGCKEPLDYKLLIDTLNKYASVMNPVFGFRNDYKINRKIQDVYLPMFIRGDLNSAVNLDCFRFVSTKEFEKHLGSMSMKDYCKLIMSVLFTSSCQNIITRLEKLEQSNTVLCYATCIKITRVLGGTSLFVPVFRTEADATVTYTRAKTKVLKNYFKKFFTESGVVLADDLSLQQEKLLRKVCLVVYNIVDLGNNLYDEEDANV